MSLPCSAWLWNTHMHTHTNLPPSQFILYLTCWLPHSCLATVSHIGWERQGGEAICTGMMTYMCALCLCAGFGCVSQLYFEMASLVVSSIFLWEGEYVALYICISCEIVCVCVCMCVCVCVGVDTCICLWSGVYIYACTYMWQCVWMESRPWVSGRSLVCEEWKERRVLKESCGPWLAGLWSWNVKVWMLS